MNNLLSRAPRRIAAIAGLFALIILAVTACGPKKQVQTPSPEEFAPFIKAYTGGIVTQDAPVRIDLTEDAAQMPTEGLFKFTPSVSGHVIWTGASSVSFIPEKLEQGKSYAVSFALGKVLANAPESFDFGITIKGETPQKAIEQEPDNKEAFRIKYAALKADKIEIALTAAPVNAQLKGLVELDGVARSYVQVQDTLLTVHFEGAKESIELRIDAALKDAQGNALNHTFTRVFNAVEDFPAVEIPLKGNILPDKESLILPFRAVNLGAVEVRVIKIYENNVLTFLQENNLGDNYGLRRCGRLIYKGDIQLDASKDLHKWNTHSIDLSGMFRQEPGALYRIRISFREDQSLWGGRQVMLTPGNQSGTPSAQDNEIWDTPATYYWDNDYDWSKYDWREAGDPSKPSYYMDSSRFPAIQLIASDLGLMAQYSGGDTIWIAATDLITAKPVNAASVEVYDFQLQRIASGSTDSKGLAELKVQRKPFAVVARAGGSTAYLKVTSGTERSVSRFDTGGETLQQGLKAFIYGERGVWRPGDTLHVNAIVESRGNNLPEGHPATLEVYTPTGQFHSKLTRKGQDGFYNFNVPTKADDPTGYWNAYLKVGGSSFHKTLHVESIKPNRLKISTSYDTPGQDAALQAGSTVKLKISAAWLTGMPAGGNKARATLTLNSVKSSPFKGFEKYTFTDLSSQFREAKHDLYQTVLDGTGKATVNVQLPKAGDAPGMLQATITTSVEETGGDESFTISTMPYSPFSAYVGIKVPDGEYLETDTDQQIHLATVDASGKRVGGHRIEYGVYKLQWNWWWESPGVGELDSYVNGGSASRIASGEILSSIKQDAAFSIRINYPEWGRFLILARDKASGHVSGRIVTIDWPEYRGRASRKDPEALTMLSFSMDKESYLSGEKATVYIPAAKGGRALVSLENSAGVLKREWVETSAKDTPYTFEVTPRMAPNFFVNITLLQPYGASANDLPIRLYGVQKVKVENPASHLEPVIKAPQVIHPEETFTISVSEASGKPMTYTLAIVDEGLLDLTAFKTPDPWTRMYRTEALGVNTWDMYDQVIGAFGGKLSPIASIGGDQDNILSARKDNRFNPVVICLPPRTVTKGTDAIRLKLPMYVGSVRVMVVAAHDGAYGSAEKAVPVQSPLMVVTTLPRILGTGEEVSVPVNVFAMEDGIKEATVTIKADGPATITGPATQKVTFSGKGDSIVRFNLKARAEGVSHITVTASGSGNNASETIALTIKNPYPLVTSVESFSLEKGQSRTVQGSVQIAGFPAVNIQELFLNARNYPYGCTEQISSRGITLVSLLPLLEEADAAQAKTLTEDLITKLYSRQTTSGGFSYWSGGKADLWVSSIAGHFLILASKAGFSVNSAVVNAWKNYQKKASQDNPYALYTLALAGEPQLSSMNRLKEGGKLSPQDRSLLASAYALGGKTAIADKLIDEGIDGEFALEALVLTGRIAVAVALAAETFPTGSMSTRESAVAAAGLRALYEKAPGSGISVKHGAQEIASAKSAITVQAPSATELVNTSDGTLYCTVLTTSQKARSKAVANGLKLEVKPVPASMIQGTRFDVNIKVTNTSPATAYESLALSYAIPSGWEIINDRLTGGATDSSYDYLDIRDDRIDWFFPLAQGKSKTFTVSLRAAYQGHFVLPATVCSEMYHPAITASTADGFTDVQ